MTPLASGGSLRRQKLRKGLTGRGQSVRVLFGGDLQPDLPLAEAPDERNGDHFSANRGSAGPPSRVHVAAFPW
jgi:hypothetical protein